jgi:solute:Na+ symporter, SSS family
MKEIRTLETVDWAVMVFYGLGMLAVGWYFSRKNKNSEDYLLGGRKMGTWPIGISLFATLFSVLTYLFQPGEMIKYGPMFWCYLFAFPMIYVVVGWYLIPAIMKLKILSAYELLEVRFGISVRLLGSFLFLILRFIWMSLIIFMIAQKVIMPIMGWSENAALWISLVIGLITVIYTSIGGLRGVVLTDIVQTVILFFGTILSIILISKSLGSVTAFIPSEWPNHWDDWIFFSTKARISFLTVVISTFCWYVFTAGSDQMAVQRYLATKNVKSARGSYLISLIADAVVFIFLAILGLSLLAYFQAHPELLSTGKTIIDEADVLFPRFIVTTLPRGFSGLVIAGLLAAAMSSLSSGVNSSCLVITKDFISRFSKKMVLKIDEVKLVKIISFCVGIIVVLLSLVVGKVKGNLLEVTYKTVNLLTAPLFVPFFLAIFVRKATTFAAFTGTVFSVMIAMFVSFSEELFGLNISFLWMMPSAFVGGVLMSIIISLFSKSKNGSKTSV